MFSKCGLFGENGLKLTDEGILEIIRAFADFSELWTIW